METNVDLTPELERFARECVSGGRYKDFGEVVRSGLRLLQEAEDRRRQFQMMLRETEEEAERNGAVTLESALAEADRIINPHNE
jgi:antitoxin ParD1/3/4